MGFDNLANYYKTNFNLMQHHKYSLHELEQMLPFERDIYILLLSQHIDERNQKIQQQQQQQSSGRGGRRR
jgi:hypothetical protein